MTSAQSASHSKSTPSSTKSTETDNPIIASDRLIAFRHFLNKYRPLKSGLILLILALGLTATTALVQQPQDLRQQAKESPTPIWKEITFETVSSTPIEATPVEHAVTSRAPLPVTGDWLGQTVKVVPSDRFSDTFINGVTAIEEMEDGRVYVGTYDHYAIKEPADTDWENLSFYDIDLQFSTGISFFTQTLDPDYEVYFGADFYSGKIVRRKTDGTHELIPDPTDTYGYLRNVYVNPYKDENSHHGVVAHRYGGLYGQIYYLQEGQVRKWDLPLYSCGSSLIGDHIYTVTTDPDTHETFALIKENDGCNGSSTKLYQLKFSIDPDIPIDITVLGTIEGPIEEVKQTFIRNRQDNPDQKIVYAGPPPVFSDKFFVIPHFYTDGQNMVIEEHQADDGDNPWIYDFYVQSGIPGQTDNVWLPATEVHGIYLGRNFDTTEPPIIDQTEINPPFLANPYMKAVTGGANNIMYTGHNHVGSQFNDALVTIFEGPIDPLPTPNPSPSPTPTPTPNPFFGNVLNAHDLPNYGYINVPFNPSLILNSQFTIEAWVKPTATDDHIVYSQDIADGPIDASTSFAVLVSNQLYLGLHDENGEFLYYTSSGSLEPSSWHHIAVTKDNQELKFFIDGQLDSTHTVPQFIHSNQTDYSVGAQVAYFSQPNPFLGYEGYIEELRVSNSARYQTSFNLPPVPFPTDQNTVLLYHFDHPDGTLSIKDSSGKKNHGSVIGQVEFLPSDIPTPRPGQRLLCQRAGGTWSIFPNACADRCLGDPPPVCDPVETRSCDCGPDACWTGTRCRPNL